MVFLGLEERRERLSDLSLLGRDKERRVVILKWIIRSTRTMNSKLRPLEQIAITATTLAQSYFQTLTYALKRLGSDGRAIKSLKLARSLEYTIRHL